MKHFGDPESDFIGDIQVCKICNRLFTSDRYSFDKAHLWKHGKNISKVDHYNFSKYFKQFGALYEKANSV